MEENELLCRANRFIHGGFIMKNKFFAVLLAGTFLSTNAFANTNTPVINADYLNSLSSPKVTWEEVTASGENTVEIEGKYYRYTYNNVDNYEEISESKTRVYSQSANVDFTDNIYVNSNDTQTITNFFNRNSVELTFSYPGSYEFSFTLSVTGGIFLNEKNIK